MCKECKKIFLLWMGLFLWAANLFAQGPDTLWTRTYGGTSYDYGYSVRQTSDGGYIVTGETYSFGAGASDVYLIKIDALGDTLWTKTYGGPDLDYGYSVQQTSDGGYIIVGGTCSFGTGSWNVYLIKTNASGDTLWTKTYMEADSYGKGFSVQQISDGGYIVVGWRGSFSTGGVDVYLIKTDANGNTLWTRTYGGSGLEWGWSVQQTSDSGYVIVGWTESFGAGHIDVYLIKTDASGDTLWTKAYGGIRGDAGYSVRETSDGGYIIAGYTGPFGAPYHDIYLIKADAKGDTLWTRTYGGTGDDGGSSVQESSDGGYIIAGSTTSFGAGSYDVYLIKIDAKGDTLWTKRYGRTLADIGHSVQQTSDGGYIIAGFTDLFGGRDSDVYLIKTDSLGNSVGIEEKSLKKKRPLFLSVIPNPAKREVIIRFGGRNCEEVRLSLYDIGGRKIMELWRGKLDKNHNLKFDKGALPSGIYFLQLETPTYIERKKIIIE